jgi:hypothetical protein
VEKILEVGEGCSIVKTWMEYEIVALLLPFLLYFIVVKLS